MVQSINSTFLPHYKVPTAHLRPTSKYQQHISAPPQNYQQHISALPRPLLRQAKRATGASPATRGKPQYAGAAASPSSRPTSSPKPGAAAVTAAGGGSGGGSAAGENRSGGGRGVPRVRGYGALAASNGANGVAGKGGDASGEAGEADTLEGFQKLVTVAVQKGMMGMSDARVRRRTLWQERRRET